MQRSTRTSVTTLCVVGSLVAGALLGFLGRGLYDRNRRVEFWQVEVTLHGGVERHGFDRFPARAEMEELVDSYRPRVHFPEGEDFGAPRFQVSYTLSEYGGRFETEGGILSVQKVEGQGALVQIALKDALEHLFSRSEPMSLDRAWAGLGKEVWQEMKSLQSTAPEALREIEGREGTEG
jgi:hypothetical protein